MRTFCPIEQERIPRSSEAFESGERGVYKPKFRLVNAVSARCGFNFSDLIRTSNSIRNYLSEKHLKAISDIYYIAELSDDCVLADAYDAVVSVDDNLL